MTARGCLFVLFATAAFAAQAVEFDEKLKAPMAASGAELKSRIEALAVKGGAADAQARVDEVRSQSFARQRFDARWLLGRMIDARKPLPELEALGFVAREDGGYVVDTEAHQEWRPLQNNLLIFADPETVDAVGGALLARGFEPGDLEVIRNYVRQHDLKRMRSEGQLALLLSAGKMAKKRQKLKLPVDDHFMWSFFYQKARNVAEVAWHKTQRLAWRDDGSLDFHVRVAGIREISWWILGYGDQAEVLKPARLRQLIARHAANLVQMYNGRADVAGSTRDAAELAALGD